MISLQACEVLRARVSTPVRIDTSNAHNIQCVFKITSFISVVSLLNLLSSSTAICAFLLLFTTFAIGLRCFSDFDKGLRRSKQHGQSYRPIDTSLKEDLLGDSLFPLLFVCRCDRNKKILTYPTSFTRRGKHVRTTVFIPRWWPTGTADINRVISALQSRFSFDRRPLCCNIISKHIICVFSLHLPPDPIPQMCSGFKFRF